MKTGTTTLSAPQVIDIVVKYARRERIKCPTGLQKMFCEEFPDTTLGGLTGIVELCTKVKKRIEEIERLAEDGEIRQKVMEFYRAISRGVRLEIALKIGLKNWSEVPGDEGRDSPRSRLKKAIMQWQEGEEWSAEKLRKSSSDAKRIYYDIYVRAGWSRRVIEVILGEESAEILTRNPYQEKSEKVFTSIHHVEKFLTQFFESLEEGKSWTRENLKEYESANGVSGAACFVWMEENVSTNPDEWMEAVFGKETKKQILQRNPLKEREKIRNADVKKYIMRMLEDLPEGQPWTIGTIRKGNDTSEEREKNQQEIFRPKAIADWIERKVLAGKRESGIKEILGEDAEMVLAKNPFHERTQKIKTPRDARKYFEECQAAFPDGKMPSDREIALWKGSIEGNTLIVWMKRYAKRQGKTLSVLKGEWRTK